MAKAKAKKNKVQKRIRVSPEERQMMLFWYTALNGNYSAVAKKVSSLTGIPRGRKTVMDIAKKHNFATYSHVVRDKVNKEYFGDDTPGMGRILKMAADLLEGDEELLDHALRYLRRQENTRVESVTEAIKVFQYVEKSMGNITGSSDPKKEGFRKIQEREGPAIDMTLQQILEELPEKERQDVLQDIVEQQLDKIMVYKE